MLQWMKKGGWILVLALIIFLSFCLFASVYKKAHTPSKISSPQVGLGGYAGNVGIVPLSITGVDVDQVFSQPEKPTDSESIVHPFSQEDNAAVSESENETESEMSDEIIEDNEQDITEDDTGGVSAPDSELLEMQTTFDDSDSSALDYSDLLSETLYTLQQIRDALGIILYLITAIIAAQIIYVVIIKPLYNHYMR